MIINDFQLFSSIPPFLQSYFVQFVRLFFSHRLNSLRPSFFSQRSLREPFTLSAHHLISHHLITLSPYHLISTSPYQHITLSAHQHITTSSHQQSSFRLIRPKLASLIFDSCNSYFNQILEYRFRKCSTVSV